MKSSAKKKALSKLEQLEQWVTRQRVQSLFTLSLSLLLLFTFVELVQLKSEVEDFDSLKGTSTNVLQELDQGKSYLSSFGQDLNEIRQFLLLPTKEYSFEEEGEVEMASEEEDLTVLLFSYVEKLGEYEENQKKYESNLAAVQTAWVETYWAEHSLTVDANGNFTDDSVDFVFLDGTLGGMDIFTVSLGYDGAFTVYTFDGSLDLSDKEDANTTIADLKAYTEGELLEVRAQVAKINESRATLAGLLSSAAVQDTLIQKSLTVGAELASREEYATPILNASHDRVAQIKLSKEDASLTLVLEVVTEGYETELELTGDTAESTLVTALLDGVDSRTEVEKLVEQRREEVESVFDDTAFEAVMSELGLQMGETTEDNARISYPILNAEGTVLRVIYIDKASGEVKVERSDGEDAKTLSAAIRDFDLYGKKKLSTPVLA